MSTYDVKNLDCTNKRKNLLLAHIPGSFPRGKIVNGEQMEQWPTIHRQVHPQGSLIEAEKCSHGIGWQQNANERVPHNLIIECMKMHKMSCKTINLISNAIGKWIVELSTAGRTSAEENILRIILEGSPISPMLFVIKAIALNYEFIKCMEDTNLSNHNKRLFLFCT